jgi:radical SAM protein with 4Fe4S-binding SPASM domain
MIATFVAGRVAHANVQITNRCNMRCGFCTFPERAVGPRDELTLAEWRKVSRRLAQEGSVLTSIEGGEPLLRPDAAAIVGAWAEHHHPFLYTNGWFMTDAIARDLYRAGAVQVGVSLDYATPEKHDRSRGLAGAYERAVAAVQRLLAAAPRGAGQVHFLTVVMDDNLDELDGVLELSGRLGIKHMISLLSTYGIYRSDRAQKMPGEAVGERLFKLKEKHPHFRFFSSYVRGIDRFLAGDPPPCGAGIHMLNIDHLGNVSSCIELAERSVGNLAREPRSRVKRKLARFEEPRTCKRCWSLCRGTTQALAGMPRPGDWWEFFTDHV